MPYQLPPELKTSKFESLPDDLRAKAEEVMAKKFNLSEVIEEKPKKKKTLAEKLKNLKTPFDELRPSHWKIEIELMGHFSRRMEVFMLSEDMPPDQVHHVIRMAHERAFRSFRDNNGDSIRAMRTYIGGRTFTWQEGSRPEFEKMTDEALQMMGGRRYSDYTQQQATYNEARFRYGF